MVALLAGCAQAVVSIDASDPNRVRFGCLRFALPGGWEIRDTTSESIVLQPGGASGDTILVESESNLGRRLSEWVDETTNEGMAHGLAYHELSHRGQRAWLAEAKDTPIAYFVIEGGARFYHIRQLRGDKAAFERVWKSIELEGCRS